MSDMNPAMDANGTTNTNTAVQDATNQVVRLTTPVEHVLLIEFNRPQVLNAIGTATGHALLDVFTRLRTDGAHRCAILTGVGDRAFSAGGDLKERHGMTNDQWLRQHELFENVGFAIVDCPVPIIAAVNGIAFGGGCELALLCDFIYAADTARFALTETRLGIMPGGGGTQNLARAAGERRAKELILGATPFSADEALAWGIANRIFSTADLREATIAMAQKIAENAPLAVTQAKKAISNGLQMDRRTAMLFEIEAYNRLVFSQDRLEGVRAFNEKRRPEFKGD